MRFAAVIFDFYGTLTHPVTPTSHVQAVKPVADFLGVGQQDLTDFYRDTYDERATGSWGNLESSLAEMARRLRPGVSFDLDELSRVRRESIRHQMFAFRADAVSTLIGLAGIGLRTGLISDCTHELTLVWPELEIAPHIEVPVFSVLEGIKKPNPEIYLRATRRLGVDPSETVFVGDGGSNELQGATDVGMTAIWIKDPAAEDAVIYGRAKWSGLSVTSLSQILEIIQ